MIRLSGAILSPDWVSVGLAKPKIDNQCLNVKVQVCNPKPKSLSGL